MQLKLIPQLTQAYCVCCGIKFFVSQGIALGFDYTLIWLLSAWSSSVFLKYLVLIFIRK